MKPFALGKSHRLCSKRAIDRLFEHSPQCSSAIAYPLRAVWIDAHERFDCDPKARFLISVPKRRLRHAVDRVAARRRVREAYRLCHSAFDADGRPLDIALVYIADRVCSYSSIQAAMRRLLAAIYPTDTDATTPSATPPAQAD